MPGPLLASAAPLIDWSWISTNGRAILDALNQHVELTALAIGAGLCISVPVAILAWNRRALRTVILAVAGLLYTIPSIALFVLVQPLTGYPVSILTAEVALTGYTLLILIRNLLTGLDAIPEEVREAAVASGYSRQGALWRVYLPLALPSLFAGLRVATVTVVGLVTITAFIGFGGLGTLILQGFSDYFYTPIVVGLEHLLVRWRPERG